MCACFFSLKLKIKFTKPFFIDFKNECKNVSKMIYKIIQFHFCQICFVLKIAFENQKIKYSQPPQMDPKICESRSSGPNLIFFVVYQLTKDC